MSHIKVEFDQINIYRWSNKLDNGLGELYMLGMLSDMSEPIE